MSSIYVTTTLLNDDTLTLNLIWGGDAGMGSGTLNGFTLVESFGLGNNAFDLSNSSFKYELGSNLLNPIKTLTHSGFNIEYSAGNLGNIDIQVGDSIEIIIVNSTVNYFSSLIGGQITDITIEIDGFPLQWMFAEISVTIGPLNLLEPADSKQTANLRASAPKNNFASGGYAPQPNAADASVGYRAGSIWIDETNNLCWICTRPTIGNAIWRRFDNL